MRVCLRVHVQHGREGGLFTAGQDVNPVLDMQSKVRDDPLLAMRKAQKSNLKTILDNPVQMRKLQEQVLMNLWED